MSISLPMRRLKYALGVMEPAERALLGNRVGVNLRAVQRARNGTQISANNYLKLCTGLGFRAVDGANVPRRRLNNLDWQLLGLGLRLTRRLRSLNMRRAAKKIGKAVSVSMISRVENGHPVSITGVIAICKFIGTQPEQYTVAEPEKFHVKPKTETREQVTA